jgi:hypothetical protein
MSQSQHPNSTAAQPESSFAEDTYFKETQLDIWQYEKKKTMQAIWAIGGVLLASDLLALLMANALTVSALIYILVLPALYVGLGLWAQKQPLAAAITASLLFAAIVALSIYAYGAGSSVSGLLIKAFVIFFMISGFNHAREAEAAKRNLKLIS